LAHVPLLHNLAGQLTAWTFDEFELVDGTSQVDSRLGVGMCRRRFGCILYCGWHDLDLVSRQSFLQNHHFCLSANGRKPKCQKIRGERHPIFQKPAEIVIDDGVGLNNFKPRSSGWPEPTAQAEDPDAASGERKMHGKESTDHRQD
jgi:hypothetical protein